jgi:signal transduction histidine kinase
LDNGVKYGEENGTVRVRLARGGDRMVFSVWNSGVGFTTEQKHRLFRRFSRLKQKGLEDRRGSGLGLYLVWWIVNRHGGEVAADSAPGRWAEFSVSLKLDS